MQKLEEPAEIPLSWAVHKSVPRFIIARSVTEIEPLNVGLHWSAPYVG